MNSPQQLAKHFKDVYFGGNWTCSNLKDTLKGVSWKRATTKVQSFNTIATLVYHIHYYVPFIIQVLEGGKLEAKDEDSFSHPSIQCQEDWERMQAKIWKDAESLTVLIAKIRESKLQEDFTEEKYGSTYRNIMGVIEHSYYHLGQIAIIKKMILAKD